MGRYIVRRLIYLVAVLIVTAAITFGLMKAVPGGPFDREKKLPPEILLNLERYYHLDQPGIVQFGMYLYNVAVPQLTAKSNKADLGEDFLMNVHISGNLWLRWMNFGPFLTTRNRTVNDLFRQQLPISFQLGVLAMLVSIGLGIPLGIMSALNQNTLLDYVGMSVAIFGVSVPSIAFGPLLVWLFGVWLGWLPPSGWGAQPPYVLGLFPAHLNWDFFKFTIMPAVVLGLGASAVIARLTRASVLQVIREDYIRTARSKGLQETLVVYRHVLKNSLIPVVTILGPMFASLITGTFVVEQIFGIPGLGRYFVTSITNREYNVIMGTILLYAVFLVVANLVVDILYAYLDPRIRYN